MTKKVVVPQQKVRAIVINSRAVDDESRQGKAGAGCIQDRRVLCHCFMQGGLCGSTNPTCRGEVNPRRRRL